MIFQLLAVHGPEIPPTTAHDAQGEFWACQEPERLDTAYMAFHLGCHRCIIGLRVVANTEGYEGLDVRDDNHRDGFDKVWDAVAAIREVLA